MIAPESEAPDGDHITVPTGQDGTVRRPRRSPQVRRRAVVLAAAGSVVVVAVAGYAIHDWTSTPVKTAHTAAGLATCGTAPTATSTDRVDLEFALTAPARAATGTLITVGATVRNLTGRQLEIAGFGGAQDLVITQDGKIVGKYAGASADTGVDAVMAPGEAATMPPGTLLLSGCPQGDTDDAHPNATRKPLPPGRYQIVGTFKEAPETGRQTYVSRPITIDVG